MDPYDAADANFDYSDNGWTNWAIYRFEVMSLHAFGSSDPCDPDYLGGQAIPVGVGCNMVSCTVDTVWYVDTAPGGLATNYVDVTDWDTFFTGAKFKSGTTANLEEVIVWHGGGFKYYVPGDPYLTDLDYIAPGDGLWVRMSGADTLLLEGERVRFTDFANPDYPSSVLAAGWNTVGVLPMTRFYFNAGDDGAPQPDTNDLQYATLYGSRAAMLQAAFGIAPADWSKVETIQMFYPVGGGITGNLLVYGRDIPAGSNTLNFVMTGYSAWIKVDSSITLQPVQPAGPQPTPVP